MDIEKEAKRAEKAIKEALQKAKQEKLARKATATTSVKPKVTIAGNL